MSKNEPVPTKLYLVFHSIHNVMLAEEILLQAGIPNKMVPVPREISSDCGMSLTCAAADFADIKTCLKKAKFTTPFKIYNFVDDRNERGFKSRASAYDD